MTTLITAAKETKLYHHHGVFGSNMKHSIQYLDFFFVFKLP